MSVEMDANDISALRLSSNRRSAVLRGGSALVAESAAGRWSKDMGMESASGETRIVVTVGLSMNAMISQGEMS
ncbi:hypothetical protein PSCICN_32990 [Pseudomonas cichorii]|nr:hypothetical protein PSCICN_32990 [Pseudomonas cichorii]